MQLPDPKKYRFRVRDFLTGNQRNPFFYLVISCFALQLVITLLQCRNLVDDAYISARYARNLAQGFGLVYNRGEGMERVEGYSNFLWVLLLALGWMIGFTMRFTAQFWGTVCGLASSLLLFFWVKKETGLKWAALIASSLLATDLWFAVWNVEGLETPLFSLLIIAVVYALCLNRNRLAMIFAMLAALTRPDGILLFASIALVQFFDLRKSIPGFLKNARAWLYFIIPYAIYFLWRWVYYRSFLPNTFYAKTGLGLAGLREGILYLSTFLSHEPVALIFVLMLATLFYVRDLDASIRSSILFFLVYATYIFLVGGDWMPHYRFGVPLLPLAIGGLLILAVRAWKSMGGKLISKNKIKLIEAMVIVFIAMNVAEVIRYSVTDSYDKTWHRDQAKFYRPTAAWLKQAVWQNQAIAVGDIGYIGYFGDHDRIIDTMGLVDRHLARLPGAASLTTDLDYIFDERPFAIVSLVHQYPDGATIGHSEFDRKVALDPRFKKNYRLVQEIFAWDSHETSRTDWKQRTSQVYFRIYLLNQS